MEENDLYTRQNELDLNPPNKVTVIGLGGIGSWVALNLAMSNIDKITLVDFDPLEKHNLNRTPYTLSQAETGKMKTVATEELITERRDNVEISVVESRIERVPEMFMEDIKDSVIIDCRDTVEPIEGIEPDVMLGYDGLSITIDIQPDYEAYWGEDGNGYETVPSCLAPPQFLANMITTLLLTTDLDQNTTKTVELDDFYTDFLEGDM